MAIDDPILIREQLVDVVEFVKSYLPLDPVVIEAGGCDGTDSVQLAQSWPAARVYTFEPVPELFQQICEKTAALSNVKVYPLALADSTGTTTLYLSEYYLWPGHVSGSSSLLHPKEHIIYDQTVKFSRSTEVPMITLDAWAEKEGISRADFLWLDMQGCELHMLKKSALAKTAKAIYIEVMFIEAYRGQYLYDDVKKWMFENGFRLAATDFEEELIQENLLTKNKYFGNALFTSSVSTACPSYCS